MISRLLLAGAGATAFLAYFLSKRVGKSTALKSDLISIGHKQLMSHRGGSGEWVENTLPAFRYSASISVDLLELDVQQTKDGQIVIFHDKTMDRLCGSQLKIKDFNYKDLPEIIIPSHLNEKVSLDPDSKRIPLLEELLDEFPMYPMQIDVKEGPEELVIKVSRMIVERQRESVTLWGSFVPSINDICYRTNPNIPIFFSVARAMYAKTMYHLGLLDRTHLYESALIMPNIWIFRNKNWIKSLRKREISVYIFTLNQPSQWEEAKNLGATGICSDYPTSLQQWLKDNPLSNSGE